jgi:hypothetical protein
MVATSAALLLGLAFDGTAQAATPSAAHAAGAVVLTDDGNDNTGVSQDTCPDADHGVVIGHGVPGMEQAGKWVYTQGHKGCIFMHGGWSKPNGGFNN